jgi:hypothetical protein
MPSLVDITPLTLEIAGIPVKGISGRGIGMLLARFPVLRQVMLERAAKPDDLIEIAPDAVAAIIAAGIGRPGDADEEARADELPIGLQIAFLTAIWKVSFPNGLGDVVTAMTAIASALPVADGLDTTAPAMN